MRHTGLILLLLTSTVLLDGCGSACRMVGRDRTAFLNREQSTGNGYHAVLSIPFKVLNKQAELRLEGIEPVQVKLPLPKGTPKKMSRFFLVPRATRFKAAGKNRVGVCTELDVIPGNRKLPAVFQLQLCTDVELVYSSARQRVTITVSGKDLNSAEVTIPPGAVDKLVRHFRKLLPKAIRTLFPAKELRGLARKALDYLTGTEFSAAALPLLNNLGPLFSSAIQLPDLPLSKVDVVSDKKRGRLNLLLLLAIPGKASYSSSLASFPKPFRKLPVLQLSGPTVAALANLAISTGVLPGRYAADGKPDPNGPLHLGLGWADDSCPAKVHLWQLEGRCLGLRLGGRPTLTIRADKLHVALREPRLEETTGDPIARIGVWLKTAWSKSLNLAADTVTKMSFSLAGKSLTVELKHAEISGNDVLLGLDLK